MTFFLDRAEVQDVPLQVVVLTDEVSAAVLLEGEADMASAEYLRSALSCPELTGATSVELFAGGLRFCDVSSLREIAYFARHARRERHRVTTLGARPVVRKLARMMHVEDDLGLV